MSPINRWKRSKVFRWGLCISGAAGTVLPDHVYAQVWYRGGGRAKETMEMDDRNGAEELGRWIAIGRIEESRRYVAPALVRRGTLADVTTQIAPFLL